MKTYQDWLKVAASSEDDRMKFIFNAIQEHKASQIYQDAIDGENYFNGENTTIKKLQKMIYNALGQPVPDYISANHKLATRFFYRSVTQATSVLLGNGISWNNPGTEKKVGKDFDKKIAQVSNGVQIEGTFFGFWNLDHLDIFALSEFCPLYDEEDGALKAGFRFWQIASDKPLRVTAYEIDGYTDYIYKGNTGAVMAQKRPYKATYRETPADGREIYFGENYPSFPVVPCYCNKTKTSELNPIRPTIDGYDLISSGYADDVDDANVLYWTITNAGGMNDEDLLQTLDKLRKLHITQLDDDQQMQAHTVDIPFSGREAILDRLEKALYKDSMTLNTYDIANGAVTATQIEAAYEPLNQKLDNLEFYITDFIQRIFQIAGIDDQPTYTRSIIVNKAEDISSLLNSALYLDDVYITEKIMTILGDKDKIQEVLDRKAAEDISRMRGNPGAEEPEQETEDETE